MGSVFDRGSTSESNWYIKYRDIDGKWHMMPSGQPTKAQARQMLVQIEARRVNYALCSRVFFDRMTPPNAIAAWRSAGFTRVECRTDDETHYLDLK